MLVRESPTKDIVVIGGSAGAAAPLRQILQDLPSELRAAILIVLHMSSDHGGAVDIVSRGAKHPVREAHDGMAVERGHIYVSPPNHHLLVLDDHLKLGHGPRENLARPAIDALFRSAAVAYGPRVIGVVLSGWLADGAAGLQAIKQCGGMTLVQDPTDARADEMPRQALAATEINLCVPSARLGPILSDLISEPAGAAAPAPPELRLEVAIAAGQPSDSRTAASLGDPVPLSCPACGGVLSMSREEPLRFRCQIGHAFSAESLSQLQESRVNEAMGVALRIVEERAELLRRMAAEGTQHGRPLAAKLYEDRAKEYSGYAETIRHAALNRPNAPRSEA